MNKIIVVTVREYNQNVKPDDNGFRCTFDTYDGREREYGYVASYKDSHFFARTKKDAIKRCLKGQSKSETNI